MTRLHVSPIAGTGALIYRSGNALAYLVGVPVTSLDKVAGRLANAEPVAWMAVLQAFQVSGAAVIDESQDRTRLRYTGTIDIQVLNGSPHPNEPDGSLFVGTDDVRIMHLNLNDQLRINPRPDSLGIGNLEGGSMAVDSLFIRVGDTPELESAPETDATLESEANDTPAIEAAPLESEANDTVEIEATATADTAGDRDQDDQGDSAPRVRTSIPLPPVPDLDHPEAASEPEQTASMVDTSAETDASVLTSGSTQLPEQPRVPEPPQIPDPPINGDAEFAQVIDIVAHASPSSVDVSPPEPGVDVSPPMAAGPMGPPQGDLEPEPVKVPEETETQVATKIQAAEVETVEVQAAEDQAAEDETVEDEAVGSKAATAQEDPAVGGKVAVTNDELAEIDPAVSPEEHAAEETGSEEIIFAEAGADEVIAEEAGTEETIPDEVIAEEAAADTVVRKEIGAEGVIAEELVTTHETAIASPGDQQPQTVPQTADKSSVDQQDTDERDPNQQRRAGSGGEHDQGIEGEDADDGEDRESEAALDDDDELVDTEELTEVGGDEPTEDGDGADGEHTPDPDADDGEERGDSGAKAGDENVEPAPTIFVGSGSKADGDSSFDAPYQPSFKKVPLITKTNQPVVPVAEAVEAATKGAGIDQPAKMTLDPFADVADKAEAKDDSADEDSSPDATEPDAERPTPSELEQSSDAPEQVCVNGHRNSPTAALCSRCGERLRSDNHARVFMRPGVVGVLTFDDGEQFDVSNDLLVGRAPGTPVIGNTAEFPSDPMMSREHFRIEVDDHAVVVRDLNSSNGTMVRFGSDSGYERLVPGEAYPLSDGAVIVAGQRWATFEMLVK